MLAVLYQKKKKIGSGWSGVKKEAETNWTRQLQYCRRMIKSLDQLRHENAERDWIGRIGWKYSWEDLLVN